MSQLYFTMAATSFRMELLRRIALKVTEGTFYSDSEYIIKPIPEVKTVVFLPVYVYKYLKERPGQSVSTASFVRNYYDHERIMSVLLQFEQNTEMSESHRKYITNVLNQHLITNYRILLEFEPDLKRGLERTKQFDFWLKENAPNYYRWTQHHIPLARIARETGYDAPSFFRKRKLYYGTNEHGKKEIKRMINAMKKSPVFINRYTMGFLKNQKDHNGLLYRTYMKFK